MHPDSRRAPRRPDESPTRLAPNQRPRASAFDVSTNDPEDQFRPTKCPHCGQNPSSSWNTGYLCRTCEVSLGPSRKSYFRVAAAGHCVGPCEGALTNQDRRAQLFLCCECGEGQDRQIQSLANYALIRRIREEHLQNLNGLFNHRLNTELVTYGRCVNNKCGRDVEAPDSDDEDIEPGHRYMYCARCRDCLIQEGNAENAKASIAIPAVATNRAPGPNAGAVPLPRRTTAASGSSTGFTNSYPYSADRGQEHMPEASVFDSEETLEAEIQRRPPKSPPAGGMELPLDESP